MYIFILLFEPSHTVQEQLKMKEDVKRRKRHHASKKFYKATTLGLFDIKVLRLPYFR